MSKKKSKAWPKIGSVRKNDYGSYIKLEDNVQILVDGEPVELNEKRVCRLQDPVKEVERMIENGIIKEGDAESRLSKAQEVSSWLKYEIVLPPPMNK